MSEGLPAALMEEVRYASQFPLYQEKWADVAIPPSEIRTFEEFEQLPFITRQDIVNIVRRYPPFGGFKVRGAREIHMTPIPELGTLPVLASKRDAQRTVETEAAVFQRAGFTAEDLVQDTFGYTPYGTGMHFHQVAEYLGCTVVPAGPGNTTQQVEWIQNLGVTALITNPSFAMHIAENLSQEHHVRLIYAGGEPFTSIEGYRERMRTAFRTHPTIVDSYGVSEVGMVATECRKENGMHVYTDLIYLEIVDPQTGKRLADGERGEIVLSHLHHEGFPLIRFRTGDLSTLAHQPCECGSNVTLPYGVFGRTDNMHKVKGVKLYPSQIAFVLAAVPGVSPRDIRVTISRKMGADYLKITVKGDASAVDSEQLKEKLRAALLISPNEIDFDPDLKEGIQVIDDRS